MLGPGPGSVHGWQLAECKCMYYLLLPGPRRLCGVMQDARTFAVLVRWCLGTLLMKGSGRAGVLLLMAPHVNEERGHVRAWDGH